MGIKDIIKSFTPEYWTIGFIETPLFDILQKHPIKVNWVKHSYKSSWFADPFILDITDAHLIVLVEEFYKPIKRGRISRLFINKKTYQVEQKDVVLELPTHLSFPAIEREGNEIYIYPENSESGHLTRYKYNSKDNSCTIDKIICQYPVADGIIVNIGNAKYLFGTLHPLPNGKKLSVFIWNEKENLFVPHKEIAFEENIARMSGDFFTYNNKLYRPTQECNIQYGHAVTLQEVTGLGGEEFHFKEIVRLYSTHPQLFIGMHTFNVYKNYIATDALGFKNMWFRQILKFIGILK